MMTLDSTDGQCVVCGVNLEKTPGMVGRDRKQCPTCYQPKPKSTRDTSAPQVSRNSRLLCSAWVRADKA